MIFFPNSQYFFLLLKIQNRWGIFAGCLLFIFIVNFLSGFVWNIEITGNSKISDAQIMQVLDDNGFCMGVHWSAFNKENVEILNYIEATLQSMGFTTWHHSNKLVMNYGDAQRLGFLGHSDTVDFIDGWHTNPFELTQKGNTLYGLGSCDMKGGIAAMLDAVTELKKEKKELNLKFYVKQK